MKKHKLMIWKPLILFYSVLLCFKSDYKGIYIYGISSDFWNNQSNGVPKIFDINIPYKNNHTKFRQNFSPQREPLPARDLPLYLGTSEERWPPSGLTFHLRSCRRVWTSPSSSCLLLRQWYTFTESQLMAEDIGTTASKYNSLLIKQNSHF